MYKFKKYNSKPFVFWDIKNKFIKKKSNKFIYNKVDFENKTFEKVLNQNTININEKVLNQNTIKNDKNIHNFREIDDLMKKSEKLLSTSSRSFKNKSSFNDECNLDELLDETLLLIVCTELIYSSNRFNKELYQKIFGKNWRNIQSLL